MGMSSFPCDPTRCLRSAHFHPAPAVVWSCCQSRRCELTPFPRVRKTNGGPLA